MADKEISIPYRNPLRTVARGVTLILFPLWGVLAPVFLLISIVGLIWSLGWVTLSPFIYKAFALSSVGSSIWTMAFCAATVYLGICSVLITGDRDITLNEQGMSFPANFMFALGFRRQRNWQELTRIMVEYSDDDQHTDYPKLHLMFESGHMATILLNSLGDGEQVDQLLLGLQVWAKEPDSQEEIAALLERKGSQHDLSEHPSFTQLWEEQMNRHFSSTAFIPLQKGANLQSGRIQVIEPIAFGGLSAVYLAQLKSTETVVLKELAIDDVSEGELLKKAQEMFKREAEILMKLSDRRIARVLDHFSEKGRSYLVLEHIAGQNLRNLIRQSELKAETSLIDLGLQLCEILQYIHNQSPPIIHKDVTPDNLVLRNGKELVLIDFGAANEFLGTATGTLVGKQAYISPEQFKGKPVIQSDIYSFGATLFFLLTGADPEPLSQSRPKTVRADLSTGIDDLVAECTNFDWRQRPSSAAEVFEKLTKLSETRTVSKEDGA